MSYFIRTRASPSPSSTCLASQQARARCLVPARSSETGLTSAASQSCPPPPLSPRGASWSASLSSFVPLCHSSRRDVAGLCFCPTRGRVPGLRRLPRATADLPGGCRCSHWRGVDVSSETVSTGGDIAARGASPPHAIQTFPVWAGSRSPGPSAGAPAAAPPCRAAAAVTGPESGCPHRDAVTARTGSRFPARPRPELTAEPPVDCTLPGRPSFAA